LIGLRNAMTQSFGFFGPAVSQAIVVKVRLSVAP